MIFFVSETFEHDPHIYMLLVFNYMKCSEALVLNAAIPECQRFL